MAFGKLIINFFAKAFGLGTQLNTNSSLLEGQIQNEDLRKQKPNMK